MSFSKTQYIAMLAIACSGFMWGVFWIPLRALDEAGIEGTWATVFFYVVPLILLLPIFVLRRRHLQQGGMSLHIAGILAGVSLVLYAEALIFTDVVRAMLLFYLTPLWSTLLARIVLGEAITGARWVTIVLAFVGILIIFKTDVGVPWPSNSGDWMGLAAGFLWAVAAVRMRGDETSHGIEFTLIYFVWGSVAALALTLLPLENAGAVPTLLAVGTVLPWLVPVAALLIVPPAFAVLWGASILSPGIVAILFMTEISVGTVTAALWANEPFGIREITGVILITFAGLLEPVYDIVKRRA